MIIQRNGNSELIGYSPSRVSISGSIIELVKALGKLGTSLGFFTLVMFWGLTIGPRIVFMLGLFYFLSTLLRIPDTYSDFAFESVATFSLILLITSGTTIAVFFAFTAIWLTRFTSPFGPVEELNEALSESMSIVLAVLLSSFLPSFYSYNLLFFMLQFQIVRAVLYQILMIIVSPATVMLDLFYTVVNFVLNTLQSYVILLAFGTGLLGYMGITGWNVQAWDFSMFRR